MIGAPTMCTTDALLAFLWIAELHQLYLQLFAASDLELQISALRALYDIILKKKANQKTKIRQNKKQTNKEEAKKKLNLRRKNQTDFLSWT